MKSLSGVQGGSPCAVGETGSRAEPCGFLGQRPKWDGATPSPSGEPTTT
jgi:hypothetical protein